MHWRPALPRPPPSRINQLLDHHPLFGNGRGVSLQFLTRNNVGLNRVFLAAAKYAYLITAVRCPRYYFFKYFTSVSILVGLSSKGPQLNLSMNLPELFRHRCFRATLSLPPTAFRWPN